MNRYNETERTGIYAAASIVTTQLKWIFREQPIVDVGIDATIEQAINKEPQGKFVALQIKTGSGNFYKKDKSLVYYATNVHYEYWLRCNIPVIMVAHLPETNKTYWESISEDKFRKTEKGWALEIPFKQEFSEKSERRIAGLLVNNNEIREHKTPEEYISDAEDLKESIGLLDNVNEYIVTLGKTASDLRIKLREFIDRKVPYDSPEVKQAFSTFNNRILQDAVRLKGEMELFAEYFTNGFIALNFIVVEYLRMSEDKNYLAIIRQSLESLSTTSKDSVKSIEGFLMQAQELDDDTLKPNARKAIVTALQSVVKEVRSAGEMVDILYAHINLNS